MVRIDTKYMLARQTSHLISGLQIAVTSI